MADKPIELPLRVRKNVGIKIWHLLFAMLFLVPYSLGDIIGPSGPIWTHLSTLAVPLAVLALFVVLIIFGRNVSELVIDDAGVTYVTRRTRLFMAWGDIERVTTLDRSVRVELKGRPEDEGVQIRAALLKKPTRLAEALRAGLARWGGSTARQGRSQLPAGAGKAQTAQTLRVFLITYATCMAIGMLVVATFLIGNALKGSDLRAHGVRMQGKVERIYIGTCARSGCRRKVEYAYTAPDGRVLHGIADLGNESNVDGPNYVYVRSHATVPIAVDPAHPSISDLNVNDSAFGSDTLGITLILVGVLCLGMIGTGSLIGIPLYRKLREAQQEVGGAARAA
jgi:hypothetical protein